MESSDPDSENINESEHSVASFEDDFDIEVEGEDDEDERDLYASHCESTEDIMAYADEPLADNEWLKKYEAENEENKRLEQEFPCHSPSVWLHKRRVVHKDFPLLNITLFSF